MLPKERDCMSTRTYDLVILGSGSAAFAAAIRARSRDARVALVEAQTIGGTCVNVGCVPSKFVLEAAQRRHDCPQSAFDLDGTIARKATLVEHLRRVKYEELLERYELDLLRGQAHFRDGETLEAGAIAVRANAYLIATGAHPSAPPIPGLADAGFLTSTTALELRRAPARLGVIGGNAIGLELGQYFARIGSRVTIFEALSSIAPLEEPEIRTALDAALRSEGIEICTSAQILAAHRRDGERVVTLAPQGARPTEHRFDALLVATGRRPNTAALDLQAAGIRTAQNGAVVTDGYLRTDNPRVYAAGDVTGAPQFVYVAAYQGALAADNAVGGTRKAQNLAAVPRVIFTQPRLAAVGETEAEARARGQAVETAVLELGENVPRAIVNGAGGAIKIVASAQERKILGVHMAGEHADEVIQAATYIVKLGLTVEDVVDTFHPYLTMAESLRLCAQTFDRDPAALSCCAS
jgi:mercuric reductase